jgi:hypothetical protein
MIHHTLISADSLSTLRHVMPAANRKASEFEKAIIWREMAIGGP